MSTSTNTHQSTRIAPQSTGFTIIELLIVIVVIAILAAITVIAFSGVQQRAAAAVLQGDLSNAAKTLALSHADDGRYPATAAEVNDNQGLRASTNTIFAYNPDSSGTEYCLQAQNSSTSYFITSSSTSPQTGTCSGSTGMPGDGAVIGDREPTVSTLASLPSSSILRDIDIDSSGNVFVADYWNRLVNRITPGGDASRFSSYPGSFTVGGSNRWSYPSGVAADSSGNTYVSDPTQTWIMKISSTGVASILAGESGQSGTADGSGSAARFSQPYALSSDNAGNVYVGDIGSDRIRKVTPSGTVTTIAGSTKGYLDGSGGTAQFDGPFDMDVDGSGNIYVVDTRNDRIRKISPSGTVTTVAGSTEGYLDGNASTAQFNSPQGIVLDNSGNIYVADSNNDRIRKITPSGTVTTIAGSTRGYLDGSGDAAQFNSPRSLVMDNSGSIYVVDSGNDRIRKISF